MPTAARVLVAFDDEADKFLPEGPRAATVLGRDAIVWVNIQTAADSTRGAVHVRFWDTGERRRYAMPARPGFAFPTDAPDTLFVGLEKAVGTLNLKTGLWTPFATIPDPEPRTIINDGEILSCFRCVLACHLSGCIFVQAYGAIAVFIVRFDPISSAIFACCFYPRWI